MTPFSFDDVEVSISVDGQIIPLGKPVVVATRLAMSLDNYFPWSWAREACGLRDVQPPYLAHELVDVYSAAVDSGMIFC